MLVIHLNLDTFQKETMPTKSVGKHQIYRISTMDLKSKESLFSRDPCVIIQARLDDEIHMVKLLGTPYSLDNHIAEELEDARLKAERWISDSMVMLEQRFSGKTSNVVVGTYYYHRDISGVLGVES